MSRLSLWFPLFVALLGMSEAVVAENMADCAAGWKAEEAGEYMHSAELTARWPQKVSFHALRNCH
jgi:hypothetical protein